MSVVVLAGEAKVSMTGIRGSARHYMDGKRTRGLQNVTNGKPRLDQKALLSICILICLCGCGGQHKVPSQAPLAKGPIVPNAARNDFSGPGSHQRVRRSCRGAISN